MNVSPPTSPPGPLSKNEAEVELGDIRHRTPGALPHERDQQAVNQGPEAGQDDTPEAQAAYQDARRGRPDTSAAPLLQQPSPAQRQPKRK
jgi:hypothetical protein